VKVYQDGFMDLKPGDVIQSALGPRYVIVDDKIYNQNGCKAKKAVDLETGYFRYLTYSGLWTKCKSMSPEDTYHAAYSAEVKGLQEEW
jgi:hypothetical protein